MIEGLQVLMAGPPPYPEPLSDLQRFWFTWALFCTLFGACSFCAFSVYGLVEAYHWIAERAERWRLRHLPPELRTADADLSRHKTIAEIMRGIGIEPVNELTWSVGAEVRKMYEARYGVPPKKALRQKTSGTGSHDFAVYPPMLVGEIEELIKTWTTRPRKSRRPGKIKGQLLLPAPAPPLVETEGSEPNASAAVAAAAAAAMAAGTLH